MAVSAGHDRQLASYVVSDALLMCKVRDGDVAALQELFHRHSGPLLTFACCLLHDQRQAEELVQDVFLELYRKRRKLDVDAALPASLYRAVTRACLDVLELGSVGGNGRRAASERDGVHTTLDRLSPSQKAAFLLSRMRGLTLPDVAECVEVPVEVAKSLIRGATARLLEDLSARSGMFRSAS